MFPRENERCGQQHATLSRVIQTERTREALVGLGKFTALVESFGLGPNI